MIHELFRSKFESNLGTFIVFVALHVALGFLLLTISDGRGADALPDRFLADVTAWLLVFCAAAGVSALLRHNRERRTRLYAQLPVSSLQVRSAAWCHAALYLCISALTLLWITLMVGTWSLLEQLRFALLYFAHAGVLLALWSIVLGNTVSLVPEDIRKRTVLYFFVATAVTFLILFVLGLIVGAYLHVLGTDDLNWTLLTLLMCIGCIGLVLLDVYLFCRKAEYLG